MSKTNIKEVRIKYYDLKNISRGFEAINGIVDLDLGICRGRVSRKIMEAEDDIRNFMKTPEWIRIDRLIDAISQKYCTRNEKDEPIYNERKYVYSATNFPLFNEAFEALKKQEKTAFEIRERETERYQKLMREDVDFDLPTIPLSIFKRLEEEYKKKNLPKPFTTETIDLLMPIIDLEN